MSIEKRGSLTKTTSNTTELIVLNFLEANIVKVKSCHTYLFSFLCPPFSPVIKQTEKALRVIGYRVDGVTYRTL